MNCNQRVSLQSEGVPQKTSKDAQKTKDVLMYFAYLRGP